MWIVSGDQIDLCNPSKNHRQLWAHTFFSGKFFGKEHLHVLKIPTLQCLQIDAFFYASLRNQYSSTHVRNNIGHLVRHLQRAILSAESCVDILYTAIICCCSWCNFQVNNFFCFLIESLRFQFNCQFRIRFSVRHQGLKCFAHLISQRKKPLFAKTKNKTKIQK